MESIMKRIMSLRKDNKINGGEKMNSIRKINPMEHKKMQELENKNMGQRNNIGLTKGLPDIRKRQFIRKGILGIIAGIGIAIFSKIARAGGINFFGRPDAELMESSRGVAKAWVSIAEAGTIESPNYNVSSITDTGAGDRTINLGITLSGNRPAGGASWARGGGQGANHTAIVPETMTGGNTLVVRTKDNDVKTDISHMHVIFEDI